MTSLSRRTRQQSEPPQNVPVETAVTDHVEVDTTWGKVQPLEPILGVRTVGELELIEMVEAGAVLIDTRVPDSRSGITIKGATNIPHDQVIARREELDEDRVSVLFCNGPQCPQTPDALRLLVDDGFPMAALAYYRGGIHDWVTLAYPTEPT